MLVCVSVCLFVCLFSTEIQMAGRIGMKFGMEVVLEGFLPWYPHPPGYWVPKGVRDASVASTHHFGKNLIKQKLQGTPDLVGVGHLFGPQIWIRKDLGPLSFWSHGHSL